mmetsp:Transcript_43565/g.128263  ORF Transcript_43565/g.128263 Transcript_43565/m.128263 type:complete len:161 (-) Transcript_43565:399-881(-)
MVPFLKACLRAKVDLALGAREFGGGNSILVGVHAALLALGHICGGDRLLCSLAVKRSKRQLHSSQGQQDTVLLGCILAAHLQHRAHRAHSICHFAHRRLSSDHRRAKSMRVSRAAMGRHPRCPPAAHSTQSVCNVPRLLTGSGNLTTGRQNFAQCMRTSF